jgi:hypothetical protein
VAGEERAVREVSEEASATMDTELSSRRGKDDHLTACHLVTPDGVPDASRPESRPERSASVHDPA